METFSALQALCAGNSAVTGGFPAQRLVTRNFDVFFDLSLNKRLIKQLWGWWFGTSYPLWRHCNVSFLFRLPFQHFAMPLWGTHYMDMIWKSWWIKSPAIQLSIQELVETDNKENTKASHRWSCVMGIHWLPVESPDKGPVMRKFLHATMSSYRIFQTSNYAYLKPGR